MVAVENVQDAYWEPTLFNLATAYRKLRYFEHAIVCLERCLSIKESASAYSALGFCYHLQAMSMMTTTTPPRSNDANVLLHQAIDTYHQSLSKKPDDPFCSEMLQKALGDALESTNFFLADTEDGEDDGDEDVDGMAYGVDGGIPPRSSMGAASAAGQSSSMWTEDGLSLSVESSSSDVDMS
jgi:tetratricopeptide (TPR) repeat protein